MADGNTVAGVAWRGHIRGIVEVQGRQFILFPKLPVGRVKIGRLIGFATEGRFTDIVVATNGAIPAVRGQFDRTCQPKVFQFTTSAGCDVFGTPQCLLVANVGSQLADAKTPFDVRTQANRCRVLWQIPEPKALPECAHCCW